MKGLLIIMVCLFCFHTSKAQTLTFSKADCRLEVRRGATLEYNLELATTTWADVSTNLIEIKDGVTSISAYDTQIGNYTGDQIDSLKLDLTSWTNTCAGATAVDIYWEAGTTSGISPKGDSTLTFEDGTGTIGTIATTTADSSVTFGMSAISGSTLASQIYGGKSFLGLGNTATGFIFQDDLTTFANFDKVTHFNALGNWTGFGFNTTTHLSATGDFITNTGSYMESYQVDTSNGTAAVKKHLKTATSADVAVVNSTESTTGNSHYTTLAEANDTNKVRIETYVEFSPTNATRGTRTSWWGHTLFKGAVNQYTFPFAKGTAGEVLRLSHTTTDTLEFVDMVNVASLDSLTATITESAFTDVVSYTSLTLGGQTIAIPETATDGWVVKIVDDTADFSARNCTIDPTGTTTINGSLTYVMNATKESVELTFDGANYIITGAYLE